MECGGQLCFFPMAEPVYGIDDFPDDDSLWRVEWIGGVGYNTSVPSDPRITVCLTQSPRARRIRSARELVPGKRKQRQRSVLVCYRTSQSFRSASGGGL